MKSKSLTTLILIVFIFTMIIQNLSNLYALGLSEEFKNRADKIETEYKKSSDDWLTQAEMNMGTSEYYEKWDTLLNEVYQYLKLTLSTVEFEKLKADQIKWIKEKEAKVEEGSKEWEGDSGRAMAMNSVRI